MKLLLLFLSLLAFINLTGYAQSTSNWRPFSDESLWNQKIPDNPDIDPDSQEMIDEFASRGSIHINIQTWSIPVYFIDADTTPKYNVQDSRPGIYGKGFEFPRQIPIPGNAVASPPAGGDNHLSIVDTVKNIEWGMWHARQDNNGTWSTGLGAVTDLSGTGVAEPWYSLERDFDAHRGRASGFPLIAGLIMVDEIKKGKINHALVFAYDRCRAEFFIPPASTSQSDKNGLLSNTTGIPMGGRIQLDPDFDVENSSLSSNAKIIARALQEYGAYCGDYAGANVICAENSPQAVAQWNSLLSNTDLYAVFNTTMIKNNFRVLKMGQLLPGQNFDNAGPYLVSFELEDQIGDAKINFFNRRIDVIVNDNTIVENLIADFEAFGPGTEVFVGTTQQTSGVTANDFSEEVIYRLTLPGGGTTYWTVNVTRESDVITGVDEERNTGFDFFVDVEGTLHARGLKGEEVVVYNIMGQVVMKGRVLEDEQKFRGRLTPGVYVVGVVRKGRRVVGRVVVQ